MHHNVLFVIADDQGRDLSYLGTPALQTPHLDELARGGMFFENAFCAVSSCSSSRSSIYTGLYPHGNGAYGLAHDVHNQQIYPWVKTMPQLLRPAGYRTGLIGKMHVRPETQFPWDVYLGESKTGGNRDMAGMARMAGEFWDQTADRPWVLVMGYSDPHRVTELHDPDTQMFGNFKDYPGVAAMKYDPSSVGLTYFMNDWPETRADVAQYYEAVSRFDAGVGLLLAELRRRRLERETLIIYLSDNGMPFVGAKTNLYDAGIRLPLVLSGPPVKPGTRSRALVSYVDLLPTVLEWCDVKFDASYALHGRSLMPVLHGDDETGFDEIGASHTLHEIHMWYPMRAVRTRRYKYILNLAHELEYPLSLDALQSPTWKAIQRRGADRLGQRPLPSYLRRPAEELYDLQHDPNELINVASSADHGAALADMRARMKRFRERTQDPFPA
jgi:N-sulfoglucosamine sulfohydrolase